MSLHHPFRILPSLELIASIKIIQTLWRNEKSKESLNDDYRYRFHDELERLHRWDATMRRCIRKILEDRVDNLAIPTPMKEGLKHIVVPMLYEATSWFKELRRYELIDEQWDGELSDEDREIVRFFIDNMTWDNFGYVDGRSMLKSYVKNKDNIPSKIWMLLCEYWMEDDIIKFSSTLNREDCVEWFNSFTPVYWYHKIYKEYPTRELEHDYLSYLKEDQSDEKRIMRSMFFYTINSKKICPFYEKSRTNIPAITYFRNNVIDDEDFAAAIISADLGENVSNDVIFYSLRAMELDTLCRFISRKCNWIHINECPCFIFIEDWINVFEFAPEGMFIHFIQLNLVEGCFETHGLFHFDTEDGPNEEYYKCFEKIWRIFARRFMGYDELMVKAFSIMFRANCLRSCEIVFTGMDSLRKQFFIRSLKGSCFEGSSIRHGFRKSFLVEFSEKLLDTNEEKLLYREIFLSKMNKFPDRLYT